MIAALTIALGGGFFAHSSSSTQGSSPAQAAGNTPAQPVLVELFTSEGCSSCPPADALLAQLDQQQFVSGADAIVLSEHVAYWDDEGWKDPFSSQALTERQNDYASRFGIAGPYTPQAVVDGSKELVGSDRSGLSRAVQTAAAKPKIPLTLDNVQWTGDTVSAQVSTPMAPGSGSFPKTTLNVALADDWDRSNVLHGENKGRDLRHVAVVRNLVEVRKTSAPLNKAQVQIKLPNGVQPQARMRLVVFLTDSHNGHVLAAAMQPVQHP